MSIVNRIENLERRLFGDGDVPLERVPEAWTLPDYDGLPVGPTAGERITEGQRRALAEITAMDGTIPSWA
jgi:hypothetical protein